MIIVIADDSSLIRERIKSLLNMTYSSFIIHEAENGLDALRLIMKKKPDLAILDIKMPGMNGIEVLTKVRALNMKTRICILTNYPYPQYKKKCLGSGADYFLDKNMEFNKISEIVLKPAGN